MVWEVWEVLLLWYTGVVLMGLSTSHLQHTPSSPLIHLYDVINCPTEHPSELRRRGTVFSHFVQLMWQSLLLTMGPPPLLL